MQEESEREELEKEVKPVEKKAYRWPAYGKNIKQFEIWTVEWRNNPNDVKHAVIVDNITTISAQALLDRIDILKLEEQQRIRRNISLILGFTL